jgi:hypothetical protein
MTSLQGFGSKEVTLAANSAVSTSLREEAVGRSSRGCKILKLRRTKRVRTKALQCHLTKKRRVTKASLDNPFSLSFALKTLFRRSLEELELKLCFTCQDPLRSL